MKNILGLLLFLVSMTSSKAQKLKPVKESLEIRFLVVGDTQGNGKNNGYASIVPQLIEDMEKRHPDFVVFTGDLVGTGSIQTLNDWKKLTGTFGNNRFMVPGNHDLPGRSATNQDWKTIFPWLPDSQEVNNITIAESNDKIKGVDKMDYYFDPTPNIRIISVTTDRDAFKKEQHTHSGGYEIIGGEPKAMDWFQSVMALESTKEKEWLFVMTHHPVTTMMSQYNAPEHFNLQAGTPSEWWKSITNQHPKYELATADALLTGHVHGYLPNHPDPNVHTAEMIIGTGGGASGSVMHRRKNGFVEVVIKNGKASCTFIGDDNDAKNGWSFTQALDTFELTNLASLSQGVKAFYQFERENPTVDTSKGTLSKKHELHFNQGAEISKVRKRGHVLSLDGKAFVDAKNVGDENLQSLNNLTLSLWIKAKGDLGNDTLDNVLLAFGDADSADHNGTWLRTSDEEVANYAYILSINADGKLQMIWEYHDDPNADSPPKKITVISTKAIKKLKRWHKIKAVRDALKKRVSFIVDGKLLGTPVEFEHLPTGGGTGSLYIGGLPNLEKENDSGIATFKGMLDDILISTKISK